MIRTENLSKVYKELIAVDSIEMEVERGDVYGFIGPNGAGKTTTLRMLAALIKPTSGDAFIAGHSVTKETRKIRHKIGYMPDFFGVYEDMKVSDYLHFFASSYRIREKEIPKILGDVLALTDLVYKKDAPIKELSRGMQQRLGLARVLIHNPEILLLDEPASGLDPRARLEISELIRELRNMGKTIIISSHILQELGDICNKIGIIEKGKLLFQGELGTVLNEIKTPNLFSVKISRDPTTAADALKSNPDVANVSIEKNTLKVTLSPTATGPELISKILVEKGFEILSLREDEVDLEDVFVKLTKGTVS